MVSYLEEKFYTQNQKIIEYYLICGLFFFQFIPTTSVTIKSVILISFLLFSLFHRTFHEVNNVRCLILILLISAFLVFYHGFVVGKDFFIFCFGILSTSYFAKIYTFSGNVIYKYLIFVIVPLSIINYFMYGDVYYHPFTNGHVNIIGNNATKHSTGILGTILFIGSFYNFLHLKKGKSMIDIISLIISVYLVTFSGSRSCLLALFATILLYLINKNKYRKSITFIYFIMTIFAVFYMEYLQNYIYLINNDFVLDLIGADKFKNYGVTSGRAWLWNYHWDSFVNSSYYLGGGRTVTDFRVGDYIPFLRMRANAGGESPYTGMIACNGIIGFLQIGLLIYLSYNAINKKNLAATCIIFICIYNATMGVDLTNVLKANPILFYLLYFSSFKNDIR